jgi:hypothetical protein
MHRTQIYLPEADYQSLVEFSRQRGHTLPELIRRAVDRYLKQEGASSFQEALAVSSGCWSDRIEPSESIVRTMRNEWSDRDLSGRHHDPD